MNIQLLRNIVFPDWRSTFSWPLLFLLCWTAAASAGICDSPDAPKVYPWTDPSTYARPLRVLPPEYPSAQLKAGVSAKVEATLRINQGGTFKEVLEIKADNGDAAFESAVREVVQHWTFRPYIDCECTPMEFTARQTVWFEIKDGQPVVSVSQGEAPPKRHTHAKPLRFLNGEEVYKAMTDGFPRLARRTSSEGVVYARVRVDPATGAVSKVDIQHVEARSELVPYFANAALSSLRQARYQIDEDAKPPIQSCITVEYRIQK